MRAHEANHVERSRDRGKPGRVDRPNPRVQRILDIQRLAGNRAVARAVQRERHQHGAGCEHDQRAAAPGQDSLDAAISSPGRPLTPRIREKGEQAFGIDLSGVRVHSGPVAQRSALEFGAHAYTTGAHIVSATPSLDEETTLHEVTHVYQQSKGPVAGTDNGAGVSVSSEGDKDEKQAAAFGRLLARGQAPDLSA